MTMIDLFEAVQQIANDFINGNISDVKKALAKLKGHQAAFVGIAVYNSLSSASERGSFNRLLATWAE
jgi:hypothetical protein